MFSHNIMATFVLCCFSLFCGTFSVPAKRSAATTVDNPAGIRTELVDGTNRKQILAMFNLTEAQMSRIYEGINAANKEAEANGSVYFKNIKEFRINDIKTRISNAIQTKNSEEIIEYPLHEMAAYPTCNSETTEATWLHDNNITIQFSSSLFEQKMQNLNLDSAILRLFKINPNDTNNEQKLSSSESETEEEEEDDTDPIKPKRCAEPTLDAQIRVTVSIVQQLRRNKRGVYERKKRICNTIMMNVSSTGWVEIDIRRAIYIWENVGKQMEQTQQTRPPVLVGWLMIEVHDEEEQPLKPGLFFKPPSCNQADLAIPWNYYRPDTAMSPFTTHEVPRYPRLDVKLIGYASFAPINQPNTQPDTVYASLKDKLFNLSHKSSSSEIDNESTTQIAATADNHLQEVDDTGANENDMQERLHHKRHLKLQKIPEPTMEDEEEDQPETDFQTDDVEYNFKNHARHHRQHRHHHRRHHHIEQHSDVDEADDLDDEPANVDNGEREEHHKIYKRHHVAELTTDAAELNIEREQHEAKLLQHIVHKLQQEQKQLLLLHQQQEQQRQAYDI